MSWIGFGVKRKSTEKKRISKEYRKKSPRTESWYLLSFALEPIKRQKQLLDRHRNIIFLKYKKPRGYAKEHKRKTDIEVIKLYKNVRVCCSFDFEQWNHKQRVPIPSWHKRRVHRKPFDEGNQRDNIFSDSCIKHKNDLYQFN